jgi:hypothetical protein
VTRARAAEYRRLGQEILAMARSVSSQEARTALMEGAELWFRLAKEQEDEAATLEGRVPPSSVEDPPVAQQQQQLQRKDKKE